VRTANATAIKQAMATAAIGGLFKVITDCFQDRPKDIEISPSYFVIGPGNHLLQSRWLCNLFTLCPAHASIQLLPRRFLQRIGSIRQQIAADLPEENAAKTMPHGHSVLVVSDSASS